MPVKTRNLKLLCAFLLACLLTFLFFFTVPQVMQLIDTSGNRPSRYLVRLAVTIFVMMVLFVWLSDKKSYFRFLVSFLVFFPAVIAGFIGLKYGITVSPVFFADVLATNVKEATSSLFSVQVVAALFSYSLFIFGLSFILGKLKLDLFPFRGAKLKIACNVGIGVLFLFSFHVHFYPLRVYYDCIRNLYIAKTETCVFIKNMTLLENRDDPCTLEKPLPKSATLFLHIGESVKATHAPMNGYGRNTMSRMMNEYKKGNLIVFPVAISFATGTRFSVAGMMTSATISDPVIKGSSFIPVITKMGVNSVALFSSMNPSVPTQHDVGINIFASHAAKRIYSPGPAHSLLPDIRKVVASADGNSSNFFLYQGEGSHFPYNNYDQNKFSRFTPVNFLKNADYSTTNAYDNTIVCTDDFIGQVLDMLRQKDAVYFYASDHGEVTGENGKWGRNGMDDMNMRNILFFIWVSDSYMRDYPEKFAALKKNRERLGAVSHDYIYHTVLGFYNIRNQEYDDRLDLFSPNAQTFSGPMSQSLPKETTFKALKFDVSGGKKRDYVKSRNEAGKPRT